jgi:hypothetical protein
MLDRADKCALRASAWVCAHALGSTCNQLPHNCTTGDCATTHRTALLYEVQALGPVPSCGIAADALISRVLEHSLFSYSVLLDRLTRCSQFENRQRSSASQCEVQLVAKVSVESECKGLAACSKT